MKTKDTPELIEFKNKLKDLVAKIQIHGTSGDMYSFYLDWMMKQLDLYDEHYTIRDYTKEEMKVFNTKL